MSSCDWIYYGNSTCKWRGIVRCNRCTVVKWRAISLTVYSCAVYSNLHLLAAVLYISYNTAVLFIVIYTFWLLYCTSVIIQLLDQGFYLEGFYSIV